MQNQAKFSVVSTREGTATCQSQLPPCPSPKVLRLGNRWRQKVESQLFLEPCLLRPDMLPGEESWTGFFLSLDVPTQLGSSPLFF